MFSRGRFDALAGTSGRAGDAAPLGAPMFACHKSREGADDACAGWLAVAGVEHLGVRLAVAQNRLDPAALSSGEDWPPLFSSFEEMAETQGRVDPATDEG